MESYILILGVSVIACLSAGLAYQYTRHKRFKNLYRTSNLELIVATGTANENLDKYKKILSQKKSSETRLGQISENLIPFLDGCPYNPKDMHFLGQPLDYLVFDLDEGKIVFLEIKSGNSRASKKQKTLKNIIQSGHVYYEEMRINEKGVKTKKASNVK